MESVFPLTYLTNNPLFPLLFQHNITYDKLAAFLDFKEEEANAWNENRCYQAMKLFMGRTRDLADTQGLSYARSLDQRPCGKAVLLSTEHRYSSCTASVLCFLIFNKFLTLSRDEGAEESNNSLILMAFVDLSTDSNDSLMKEIAACCSVCFHKNSRTLIEESIPHVSSWLSAFMHLVKRVWSYKKASLNFLGVALQDVDPDSGDLSEKGQQTARSMNLVRQGRMDVVAALQVLFYLKCAMNRSIGDNINEFDVLVDTNALDKTREFIVTVRGVRIKAKEVGEIAQYLAKHCLDLLLEVFGGVDTHLPGGTNPHISDFLKGLFRVEVDDAETETKNATTFSYTVDGGGVFTSADIEKLLLTYFMSLTDEEMVLKETKFYRALNLLEVVISLLGVQRSTEFGPVTLTDSAGGLKRMFRAFNMLRCELSFEPLLVLYRRKKKWNNGVLARICVSFVPPFLNRLFLGASLRTAFAAMVMKRTKEAAVRPQLLSNLFLTSVGDAIPEEGAFTSTNFNTHVRKAIEQLNVHNAGGVAVLPQAAAPAAVAPAAVAPAAVAPAAVAPAAAAAAAAAAVDQAKAYDVQPVHDPIAVFTTSLERHFFQVLLAYVAAEMAAEDQYSAAALSLLNQSLLGHGDLSGRGYMSSAAAVNETSPAMTSGQFSVLFDTTRRAWKFFDIPCSMNPNAVLVDTRADTFWSLLKLLPGASDDDAATAALAVLKDSDAHSRAVGAMPGVRVDWRSAEQAALVSRCLANDANPRWSERARLNVGVFLETGAGKSLAFLVPALLHQLLVKDAGANVLLVVVHRLDLCQDVVDRAIACGVRAKAWNGDTMSGIMQRIRRGDGPSLLVSVVDALVGTDSLAFLKELVDRYNLRRAFIDEAHALIADAHYRERLRNFTALARHERSILSRLSFSFLSGTMPQEVVTALLDVFGLDSLASSLPCSPFQNSLVQYVAKRAKNKEAKMACILREAAGSVERTEKMCVGCMTIQECSDVAAVLKGSGLRFAMNNSDVRRTDPRTTADNLRSWLGTKKGGILLLVTTLPLAGVDAKDLSLVIACGSHSVVDAKQTLGRLRNAGVGVLLTTAQEERSFSYLDTDGDDRPLSCRPESMRNLFAAVSSGKCLRAELMKACGSSYVARGGGGDGDDDDDDDDIGDLNTFSCRALKALGGNGAAIVLCSTCADGGTVWSPEPPRAAGDEQSSPLFPPPPPPPRLSGEPTGGEGEQRHQKRPGTLTNSYEARANGLLSAAKRATSSFEDKVAEAYTTCLHLVNLRSDVLTPLPCLFCDSESCLLTKARGGTGWCGVFLKKINYQWSSRCLKCFGLRHQLSGCGATSSTYHNRTCQHCMSPTCSYITKANHDPNFRQYSAECADGTGFDRANRAKNVIFRTSRDKTIHASFNGFVTALFGREVVVPPYDEQGWVFFTWCFAQVLSEHAELHHVLNYNILLLFWLSEENKFNRV